MKQLRLQDRDKRVITDCFLHHVLRRDDLLSLGHFASIPRCNDRLAKLADSKWLRRLHRVNSVQIRQGLYAPGEAAISFLTEQLDLPRDEIARVCFNEAGLLLIEHALRTLDFRLRLFKEAPIAGVSIGTWLCEAECLHEFSYQAAGGWRSVLVKPDGGFEATSKGNQKWFFIETDLGHMSLPRFNEKLRRYEQYQCSGAFSETYESATFSVLTVTRGNRRAGHLASLKAPSFDHLVTTWELIEGVGMFGPIWRANKAEGKRLFEPQMVIDR